MKMNVFRILAAVSIVLCLSPDHACAQSVQVGSVEMVGPRMSNATNAPHARGRRARMRSGKPTGGFLIRKPDCKIIAIRNAQKIFSHEEVDAATEKAKFATYLPVTLISADDPRSDIAIEIVLLDHPVRAGRSVVVAPEQNYAELAVDWLVSDNPTPEKRASRLNVEVMRAVAMAFGCGTSMFLPDVMVNVNVVRDLDRISATRYGPATCNVIEDVAKRLGLKKIVFASYRRACQEGWAPAPETAVQKQVWDEVHAMPSAPIVIAPETNAPPAAAKKQQ